MKHESDSENLFMALRNDINVSSLQKIEDIDLNKQLSNLLNSLKEIEGDSPKEIRQSLDATLALRQSNEEGERLTITLER